MLQEELSMTVSNAANESYQTDLLMVKKQQGVTLLELMIVVAILGIIVAIALPSFQTQTLQTRRADCAKVLASSAITMERYFSSNSYSYAGATAATGGTIFNKCPVDGNATYYNVSLNNVTATTFTISAAPVGTQANDGCGTLSLDQAGTKAASGGSVADCW